LNQGPKDYESRHPNKTIRISRGYVACLSVCELLCGEFHDNVKRTSPAFGLEY